MFEESTRKLIKELYANGVVTEKMLEDAGFREKDIADFKFNKEWFTLYDNIEDYNVAKTSQLAVVQVLGRSWKRDYEYSEWTKYGGKYGLKLKVEEDVFERICGRCRTEYAARKLEVF